MPRKEPVHRPHDPFVAWIVVMETDKASRFQETQPEQVLRHIADLMGGIDENEIVGFPLRPCSLESLQAARDAYVHLTRIEAVPPQVPLHDLELIPPDLR